MNNFAESKKNIPTEHSRTSEYRLKDSIKQIGLLQPLVYVRSSNTQEFELFGGGRRRLKLLNAVQKERKENGQEPVPVPTIVRNETVSGSKIELSHLIQNHIRRRRKFVDRALHLNDCLEAREKEIARKLSQRESVRWLREHGFPISQSLLSDMLFTVRKLYPLLPQALCNGLGRRHIATIRKLNRAMREVWKSFGEDLEDCHEAFEDICEECDEKTFDIELFLEVMEREICLWCDLNSQYVRAMLMVDHKERAHLIKSIATSDRKGMPVTRPLPKPAQPKITNTTVVDPSSKYIPLVFDLPPAVTNRRKRYARRLALDLARSVGLLACVSGSINNTIGYHILRSPNRTQTARAATWQILDYCQQTVQSIDMNSQRIRTGWRLLEQTDFGKVVSLLEVTRTLRAARHKPETKTQLQKAA
ncbi:MAG: hypothetical protein F4X56_04030 [Gammaproteobacteria bacterium]|nr:hypothetical protein [Gammaproteobacteria bacterium]